MRGIKHTLIVTLTIFVFIISACKFDKQKGNQPRLPLARNSKSIVNNDSCIFSISLRDSSIVVSDYVYSIQLKNFEQIGDFVCQEIKSGNINPKVDYPINLEIDSLTPFPVFDRMIEELKLIGFHAAFLKTAKNGVFAFFAYNEYELLDEVIKLYGKRYSIERPVLAECSKEAKLNLKMDSDLAVTPPPPPPIDYSHLKNSIGIDSLGFCVIEKTGDGFLLNHKPCKINEFCGEINKKYFLVIKLTNHNVFNDLIQIIDLIRSTEFIRYDYFSELNYKSKFSNLNADQQHEIKREHHFSYLILSLAEQSYMDKKL